MLSFGFLEKRNIYYFLSFLTYVNISNNNKTKTLGSFFNQN